MKAILVTVSDLADSLLRELYNVPDAQILRINPTTSASDIRQFLADLKEGKVIVTAAKLYKALKPKSRDMEMLVQVPPPELVWKNPKLYKARIEAAIYPKEEPNKKTTMNIIDPTGLQKWLRKHIIEPMLAVDIETTGLNFMECEILSIAFATEKEAVACLWNHSVASLLHDFFIAYEGTTLWHNISFDASVLIRNIYMCKVGDTPSMLDGLEYLFKNWEDTRLMTYLCTNSCQLNELSLKKQALEYLGDYGLAEIKDASSIPKDTLLEYNMKDCLATWFVFNKYEKQMKEDEQEDVYNYLFKPATKDIVHMQLTGIPVDTRQVTIFEQSIEEDLNACLDKIRQNVHVYKGFNPSSSKQISEILYKKLRLPVISMTKNFAPTTDKKTLTGLLKCCKGDSHDFIQALLDYQSTKKIKSTFIPILKKSVTHDCYGRDINYIHGHFNLGGTVSGRLSSSNPNLQNLPATGTKYASQFKECIAPPKGWVWLGADFSPLEDKISALTTKDPAKLKVYTDGYDGHCLRAYYYFKDQMPDIEETVESINSIKHKYPELRQKSKAPTFALTYAGTWRTLVSQCGFEEKEAKRIENAYRELYSHSIDWVSDKITQAAHDGYVTGAFGLRVRTPVLHQTVLGNQVTPQAAAAEARTAGNALGQSWCLLNTRALTEIMEKVRKSIYRAFILPCAQIHDAMYFLVQDRPEVIAFATEAIQKAMLWQKAEAIAHPDVFLGGEVTLYRKSWNQPEKD